jgi:hypothetical protein
MQASFRIGTVGNVGSMNRPVRVRVVMAPSGGRG